MSNLYYNYRGDNANHRASPANPSSQQHLSQAKSGNTASSAFPLTAAEQGIQLRPSSALPSAQATSAGFSSPQAWAADQTIQHQSTTQHQSQTPQHQPNLVDTAYPRTQPSRTTANTAMNGTRAAPLGTRRVSQYDDSIFQMMTKGFTDKNARNNPPVSSISLQGPPPGTIEQYQQMRSGASSNVFDPNDFPSLGGGLAGQGGITAGAAALLNSSSALDTSGVGLPSSANGLGSYDNMYSIGGYGDGRAKAVDAVTGASVASEFSMHSEDFPALGGNSVPGSMPLGVIGNGAGSNIFGGSGRLGGTGTSSGDDLSLFDGYLDSNSGRGVHSQQTQGAVGRGGTKLEQPNTGGALGRATQVQGDYPVNQSRGNAVPQSMARGIPVHDDKSLHDANRSPSKPEFPLRPPPPGMVENNESRVSNGDKKGTDNFDVLSGRNGRPSQGLPSMDVKAIPNGDAPGPSSLPSGMSGGRTLGRPPVVARGGGDHQGDEKKHVPILPPDQYGMKGLLRYVGEEAEGTDANMLSIGVDLTMLGLDLNSPEPLHKTFANPWEGGQGGVPGSRDTAGSIQKNEEPDYKLPTCYYMQPPALKNSHFTKFQLETLFYVFYNMPRDVLQVLAAIELYNRKWRYHKDLKLWFTCEPEVLQGYERGAYIYFDIKSWEQRPFHDANQSFIQGLMTEEELRSVPMPGQRPAAS